MILVIYAMILFSDAQLVDSPLLAFILANSSTDLVMFRLPFFLTIFVVAMVTTKSVMEITNESVEEKNIYVLPLNYSIQDINSSAED